jgi:sugar (pentulose or hexulose) kinase
MLGLTLGLDIGSSVAKAALFDADMVEVATAATPVVQDRSRVGLVEFDVHAVQASVAALIHRVAARAGSSTAAITAVGISAAMVGGVLVDADNRPLRPGINWEDARAQGLIDAIEVRDPGARSRIFRSSGCVLQQGCTLPVLAALAMTEPQVVAQAHAFVSLKDHLRAWLTGRIGADRTEAAVGPGSAALRDRSPAMHDLFGLGPLARLLPPAEDSEALGGFVTPKAAAITGLRVGTPVAVGAGDVPCSVLGAGGWNSGRATMILGTTAMVGQSFAQPVFDPPDLGLLFTLPGQRWFRAMVNVAGTLNLDWALSTLTPDLATTADPFAAFEARAAQSPIGASGVSYLPYLSDSGIIAPVIDPEARAGFAGLTPRHGPHDMLRAVYEGVAFSLVDLLDLTGFSGDRIALVGGGARSALWPGMIADITGNSVDLFLGREFGARGAALLARVAVGDLPDVSAAAALAPPLRRSVAPDPSRHMAYSLARENFCRHRQRMFP